MRLIIIGCFLVASPMSETSNHGTICTHACNASVMHKTTTSKAGILTSLKIFPFFGQTSAPTATLDSFESSALRPWLISTCGLREAFKEDEGSERGNGTERKKPFAAGDSSWQMPLKLQLEKLRCIVQSCTLLPF